MPDVEKKVLYSYTVTRNSDGSVDVADAGVEGVEPIEADAIYEDVRDVADKVLLKRIENAAFVGAYQGVSKFFQDVEARNAAAMQPASPKE